MAFALAQNLQEYFNKEVTGYLVTTTLVIVLFTIVILGGSTLPLLKVINKIHCPMDRYHINKGHTVNMNVL